MQWDSLVPTTVVRQALGLYRYDSTTTSRFEDGWPLDSGTWDTHDQPTMIPRPTQGHLEGIEVLDVRIRLQRERDEHCPPPKPRTPLSRTCPLCGDAVSHRHELKDHLVTMHGATT